MVATAEFVSVPKNGFVRISGTGAANTARDGSGTIGTNIFNIATFGAKGGRVDMVSIRAVGPTGTGTTAGMIRFWHKSAAGVRLIHEQPVSSVNPSSSAAGFSADLTALGWVFEPNAELLVSSQVADAAANQFDIGLKSAGNF